MWSTTQHNPTLLSASQGSPGTTKWSLENGRCLGPVPGPEGHSGTDPSQVRWLIWIRVNDPSAGSPTETLLRLLLPLNDKVWSASQDLILENQAVIPIRGPHRIIQSVGATGGVYKGQGRNQHELMTRAY